MTETTPDKNSSLEQKITNALANSLEALEDSLEHARRYDTSTINATITNYSSLIEFVRDNNESYSEEDTQNRLSQCTQAQSDLQQLLSQLGTLEAELGIAKQMVTQGSTSLPAQIVSILAGAGSKMSDAIDQSQYFDASTLYTAIVDYATMEEMVRDNHQAYSEDDTTTRFNNCKTSLSDIQFLLGRMAVVRSCVRQVRTLIELLAS